MIRKDLWRYTVSIELILFIIIRGAVLTPLRSKRLSEVEWNSYNYKEPSGTGTYAFGYDIEDPKTSNVQYRNEERLSNGSVIGSYGYLMPNGNVQSVSYVADENGYRASVKIVPRGNLKPIKLDDPENQLFDFSSNIPSRSLKSVLTSPIPFAVNQPNTQYPYNIPNYISSHLENQNNYLQNKLIPYHQTALRTPVNFKNQFEDYYFVPVTQRP